MPTEKLSMRKIKEILKLHYEQSLGNREIARRLRMGASSVSRYLKKASAARITWPLSEEWTDDKIYEILFPNSNKKSENTLPDFGKVHKELKRKGVTLLLLWHEYKSNYPHRYSYSRYCELYQNFTGKLKPSMRLTHHAGEVRRTWRRTWW